MGLILTVAVVGTVGDAPGGSAGTDAARIRAHLYRTLAALEARNLSHLDPGRRAARVETLAWLAEYADRGVYPHNHVVPERTPIFVDPHGTPCAVGYLLLRSGRDDLVRDVVASDNRVRVPDLAGEPRLEAWLDERGLTLDEAAAIQPAYPGDPGFGEEGPSIYEGATVGVSVLTAALASYAIAAPESARRASWTTPVAAGALVGHAWLLLLSANEDVDAPGWAVATHAAGLVAGTILTAYLSSEPTEAPTEPTGARTLRATPLLAPDRVGFALTWR